MRWSQADAGEPDDPRVVAQQSIPLRHRKPKADHRGRQKRRSDDGGVANCAAPQAIHEPDCGGEPCCSESQLTYHLGVAQELRTPRYEWARSTGKATQMASASSSPAACNVRRCVARREFVRDGEADRSVGHFIITRVPPDRPVLTATCPPMESIGA